MYELPLFNLNERLSMKISSGLNDSIIIYTLIEKTKIYLIRYFLNN